MELRCPARKKLFAVIDPDDNTIEVRCRNKVCGYGPGMVIIHKFDLSTGVVVGTHVFREPDQKGVTNNDHSGLCAAVRTA